MIAGDRPLILRDDGWNTARRRWALLGVGLVLILANLAVVLVARNGDDRPIQISADGPDVRGVTTERVTTTSVSTTTTSTLPETSASTETTLETTTSTTATTAAQVATTVRRVTTTAPPTTAAPTTAATMPTVTFVPPTWNGSSDDG